jgi:hypothetical protein
MKTVLLFIETGSFVLTLLSAGAAMQIITNNFSEELSRQLAWRLIACFSAISVGLFAAAASSWLS